MSVPRKIRVLRVLEYTYESVEIMETDMQKWAVQIRHTVPGRMTIRSSTLPLEIIEPEPQP